MKFGVTRGRKTPRLEGIAPDEDLDQIGSAGPWKVPSWTRVAEPLT
jgi:hypothetical protein